MKKLKDKLSVILAVCMLWNAVDLTVFASIMKNNEIMEIESVSGNEAQSISENEIQTVSGNDLSDSNELYAMQTVVNANPYSRQRVMTQGDYFAIVGGAYNQDMIHIPMWGDSYTVLIVDNTNEEYFPQIKEAAFKFLKGMAGAGNENYICVMCYGQPATLYTNNFEEVKAKIRRINAYPVYASYLPTYLSLAKYYLDNVITENATKSVVFLTKGDVEIARGEMEDGKYTSSDISYYSAANYNYNLAQQIKDKGYNIFVGHVTDEEEGFSIRFYEDIQNAGYCRATGSELEENVMQYGKRI